MTAGHVRTTGSSSTLSRPAAVDLAARALTLVLAASVAVAGTARAQGTPDRFRARVETYVDRNATVVVRPRVSADLGVGESHRVSSSYSADMVTSASIDVVTRASQAVDEVRHDGTVAYSVTRERRTTTLGYAIGREPDYLANTVRFEHARPLDERDQQRLELSLVLSHGRVGTVIDRDFARSMYVATFVGRYVRVLTRSSLARLSLELANVYGFQSSAYRTVRLGAWTAYRETPTDPEQLAWVFVGVTGSVRERHPSERFRARLAAEFVQDLGAGLALATSGAAYADTFGILAGELALELRCEPREHLLVRLGGRANAQGAAWFYRARYTDPTETRGYVTDDKELGSLRSYEAHAVVEVPAGPVRLEGRVELDVFRYPTFTLLPRNEALVVAVAMSYER